jgi:hypothetical protein
MPAFIADETQEIGEWLVGQLVLEIDAHHPTIEEMKFFLKQAAEVHDLPLPDKLIDGIIEIAYYKWKFGVIDSGRCERRTGQNPASESTASIAPELRKSHESCGAAKSSDLSAGDVG